jgi:hypothetical protein
MLVVNVWKMRVPVRQLDVLVFVGVLLHAIPVCIMGMFVVDVMPVAVRMR